VDKQSVFLKNLNAVWPELKESTASQIYQYYQALILENQKQNITRITSVEDFIDRNILDIKALLDSKFLEGTLLDLGSGGGLPGLLYAITTPSRWVLTESETRKSAFLSQITEDLGLSKNVSVFSGRAEDFLKTNNTDCIIVRAVGSLLRLYKNLRPCSTWNHIILLKGQKWEHEKKEFLATQHSNELTIQGEFNYPSMTPGVNRVIVKLTRVPRGT